jgi:hypothetical protein
MVPQAPLRSQSVACSHDTAAQLSWVTTLFMVRAKKKNILDRTPNIVVQEFKIARAPPVSC